MECEVFLDAVKCPLVVSFDSGGGHFILSSDRSM